MAKIDTVESLPWNFAIDSETGEVYQVSSGLTPDGRQELPDPIPMAPPVGFVQNNESLVDMVRRFVRSEYLAQATREGGDFETFEEADDFGWDDEDKLTPYEEIFEPPVVKQPVTTTGGAVSPASASQPSAEGGGPGAGPSQKEAPPPGTPIVGSDKT